MTPEEIERLLDANVNARVAAVTAPIMARLAAQQVAVQIVLLTLGRKNIVGFADMNAMKSDALKMATLIGRRPGVAASGVRLAEALEEIFDGAMPRAGRSPRDTTGEA
jgi:LmbE family N-acetylglucosaminyl deacetylase